MDNGIAPLLLSPQSQQYYIKAAHLGWHEGAHLALRSLIAEGPITAIISRDAGGDGWELSPADTTLVADDEAEALRQYINVSLAELLSGAAGELVVTIVEDDPTRHDASELATLIAHLWVHDRRRLRGWFASDDLELIELIVRQSGEAELTVLDWPIRGCALAALHLQQTVPDGRRLFALGERLLNMPAGGKLAVEYGYEDCPLRWSLVA